MEYKEITRNTYDQQADKISSRFAKYFPTYRKPVLDKFLGYIKGSKLRILDIGCGSGDAMAYVKSSLSEKEPTIIGVDISEGMLKIASKKNITVVQMDMENLAFVPESFDVCWAMNSLLHLPKKIIPDVLQQMADLLAPNGIVFISLKKGIGEQFVKTLRSNRFYSFWEKDEFLSLTEKHFEVMDITETNRAEHQFLNYYLRKT